VWCQVHVGLVAVDLKRCTAVADIGINSVPEEDVQIAVTAAATGGISMQLRSDIGGTWQQRSVRETMQLRQQ
jgi:hypothetical protein